MHVVRVGAVVVQLRCQSTSARHSNARRARSNDVGKLHVLIVALSPFPPILSSSVVPDELLIFERVPRWYRHRSGVPVVHLDVDLSPDDGDVPGGDGRPV